MTPLSEGWGLSSGVGLVGTSGTLYPLIRKERVGMGHPARMDGVPRSIRGTLPRLVGVVGLGGDGIT